jgi:omega-6 fatty acid desaturase (delta-12 desaturase)
MTQPDFRSPATIYDAAAEFQDPTLGRSLWQILNSVIPYLCLLLIMYWSLGISYGLTVALAIPAAGFLTRIFIIFHDCGHGSFFRSRRANRAVGSVVGLLFFLPFHYWTHQHAIHHATTGDLDRRGSGDVHTITVREYVGMSRLRQFLYRAYRHPVSLLLIGPVFTFFIRYRYWHESDGPRRRRSAMVTNLALLAIVTTAALTIGFRTYLLIQLPILLIAGTLGVWLFYVQHQFEWTYWEKHEDWNHLRGALKGSSLYALPPLLQWFTGNIGFHHVHHLNPRIPNYRLQAAHEAIPELHEVRPITLRSSLLTMRCNLWCENRRRMVSFAEAAA